MVLAARVTASRDIIRQSSGGMIGSSGGRGGWRMVFGCRRLEGEGEGREHVGDEVHPEHLDGRERDRHPGHQRQRRRRSPRTGSRRPGTAATGGCCCRSFAPARWRPPSGRSRPPGAPCRRSLWRPRCRGAHRDPDVRRLHRRPIVDAVPRHGHDFAVRLQGADDPQLVFGRDAGVDVDASDGLAELLRRQPDQGAGFRDVLLLILARCPERARPRRPLPGGRP